MENKIIDNNAIAMFSTIRDLANKLIITELTKRGYTDICSSHGEILYNLYKYKKLNMRDLASKIKRDKSTVTVLVKKLENIGYIKKIKSDSDARMQILSLTSKSDDFYPIFQKVSFVLNSVAFKGFKEDEIEVLIDMLSRVINNIKENETIS
ncbi:MarR family winged helix-turn-helix transcriptional regulator [Arcobacteraceae bacterium]|nr:MarR family winged helix-turn-helix transcriptional regulator [Arcobacteraceae bacterium]